PCLARFEPRVGAGDRPAVAVLERQPVERDVARRALELEGLDHAVRREVAEEDAVEYPLVLDVRVDVAPAPAGSRLPRVEAHLVLPWTEPLDDQLRVRVGL